MVSRPSVRTRRRCDDRRCASGWTVETGDGSKQAGPPGAVRASGYPARPRRANGKDSDEAPSDRGRRATALGIGAAAGISACGSDSTTERLGFDACRFGNSDDPDHHTDHDVHDEHHVDDHDEHGGTAAPATRRRQHGGRGPGCRYTRLPCLARKPTASGSIKPAYLIVGDDEGKIDAALDRLPLARRAGGGRAGELRLGTESPPDTEALIAPIPAMSLIVVAPLSTGGRRRALDREAGSGLDRGARRPCRPS